MLGVYNQDDGGIIISSILIYQSSKLLETLIFNIVNYHCISIFRLLLYPVKLMLSVFSKDVKDVS